MRSWHHCPGQYFWLGFEHSCQWAHSTLGWNNNRTKPQTFWSCKTNVKTRKKIPVWLYLLLVSMMVWSLVVRWCGKGYCVQRVHGAFFSQRAQGEVRDHQNQSCDEEEKNWTYSVFFQYIFYIYSIMKEKFWNHEQIFNINLNNCITFKYSQSHIIQVY